jgi:hypothetical protein
MNDLTFVGCNVGGSVLRIGDPEGERVGASVVGEAVGRFVGEDEGFLVLGASVGDSDGLGVINSGAGVGFGVIRGTFVSSFVGDGVSVVTVLSQSSCKATS